MISLYFKMKFLYQVCKNIGMASESWRHSSLMEPSTNSLLLCLRAALSLHSPGRIRGLRVKYTEHIKLLNAAEMQVIMVIVNDSHLLADK